MATPWATEKSTATISTYRFLVITISDSDQLFFCDNLCRDTLGPTGGWKW